MRWKTTRWASSSQSVPLADVEQTYLQSANDERRLSFRGLKRAVEQWAMQFEELGLARGSTVAIAIADPIEFSGAFLAIVASGRWAAPLDPNCAAHGSAGLASAVSRVGRRVCGVRPTDA
jgi:acyl-coenzyme A synthetase/AMP-(fatty) acid ligase